MKLPIFFSSLALLCQTSLTAFNDEPLLQLAQETLESKQSLNLLLLDIPALLEQGYTPEELCEEILRLDPDLLYLQNVSMESTAYQIYDLLVAYYPYFDADSSLAESWMIVSKSAIISLMEEDPLLRSLLSMPNGFFAGEINKEYLVTTAPASMWKASPGKLACITRYDEAYAFYYNSGDLFCADVRGNIGGSAKEDCDGNQRAEMHAGVQGTTDRGDTWEARGEAGMTKNQSGETKMEAGVSFDYNFKF